MRNIVIKVQLSLASSAKERQVMAYNETRQLSWNGPASDDIVELMDGRNKAFFYARMTLSGKLDIVGEAPSQDW